MNNFLLGIMLPRGYWNGWTAPKPSGFQTFRREYRTSEELDQTEMYPHECPECGMKAFVGLNLIDCTNRACRHFFKKF